MLVSRVPLFLFFKKAIFLQILIKSEKNSARLALECQDLKAKLEKEKEESKKIVNERDELRKQLEEKEKTRKTTEGELTADLTCPLLVNMYWSIPNSIKK